MAKIINNKNMKLKITFLAIVIHFCITIPATAQLVNGAVYKIKNTASGRYAQTGFGSLANGATIHLYDNQEANHFKWKAIYVNNGYYKFQNMQSNKYLAVLDASRELNAKICQWDDALRQAVTWKLERTSTGFKLKNRNSGLFAGMEAGGTGNGALLVQGNDDVANDKTWQFEKVNLATSTATGRKVLFDVVLNYIAVNESTRNRVDNGDCKRVFGYLQTELWELDENNEMKLQLASYNNVPEFLFNQRNFQSPAPAALSYQLNMDYAANNQMGKVTYNIPEVLLARKKVMLVIKTYLGTRHKDNDFATYDCLKMDIEKQSSFILDNSGVLSETIMANTELSSSRRDMHLQDYIIPFAIFQKTDDSHKLWIKIATRKN